MLDFFLLFMTSVLVAVLAGGGAYLWIYYRGRPRQIKRRLAGVRARLDALGDRIPTRRNILYSEFPVIEASASIEAWLLQNQPKNALVAAMHAVKEEPDSGDAYLHLARTLLYCKETDGARRALQRARSLGQSGPALDYLDARLRLQRAGILDAQPQLRNRAEALAILERLLETVEKDPHFGDAAYHLGKLALAFGLEKEGKRLLEKVEPLMEASPELTPYTTDLDRLN